MTTLDCISATLLDAPIGSEEEPALDPACVPGWSPARSWGDAGTALLEAVYDDEDEDDDFFDDDDDDDGEDTFDEFDDFDEDDDKAGDDEDDDDL